MDDFREAYRWLSQNTAYNATVMSWWDYGYQIAGMANRTTLVDNNTWNNSHIALVGKAMSSNESRAYEIMTELNVDYVLVIFGGVMGYSGMYSRVLIIVGHGVSNRMGLIFPLKSINTGGWDTRIVEKNSKTLTIF